MKLRFPTIITSKDHANRPSTNIKVNEGKHLTDAGDELNGNTSNNEEDDFIYANKGEKLEKMPYVA